MLNRLPGGWVEKVCGGMQGASVGLLLIVCYRPRTHLMCGLCKVERREALAPEIRELSERLEPLNGLYVVEREVQPLQICEVPYILNPFNNVVVQL